MTEIVKNVDVSKRNVSKGIGLIGGLLSICVLPPVFDIVFSVEPLADEERGGLWIFCGSLLCISSLLFFRAKAEWLRWSMLFFSVLILLLLELGFRTFYNAFAADKTKKFLALAVNKTSEEFRAYKGHPFVSFTGVEGVTLVGNQRNYKSKRFNSLGFLGEEFNTKKEEGIIRIAALGGSTTASGYPKVMETYLNEHVDTCLFEVMNFGMTYWTTAHSMTNFLLNVVDFSPDYVIIHHAWNDSKPRGSPPDQFRADYSHEFTYFHEPDIRDKIPIRISAIYRYFKFYHTVLPTWAFIGNATSVPNRELVKPLYGNLDELQPYERNIRTIIDLAILRDIRVVLTTQPFCHDPSIPYHFAHVHIEQCNEILKRIAKDYGNRIVYLDLAQNMGGRMNHVFKDLGHMNDEGIDYKSKQIGNAIIYA